MPMNFLELTVDNAARLAVLAVPAALGALATRVGLFRDVPAALGTLNTYALYIGFPALVLAGVLDDSFALPSQPAFWAVVPLAHLALVGLCRPLASAAGHPSDAGSLALVGLFGNVAYLGLPLAVALLGPETRGLAALLVSVHVAMAIGLGPGLLRRWSVRLEADSSSPRRSWSVWRQPLFWAPWLGLAARTLPDTPRGALTTALTPLAASAAPIALFLLGVYVFHERARFRTFDRGLALHVALRLVLAPGLTAAVAYPLVSAGALPASTAGLCVLLAGMPTAITTFAIAHDAGAGSARVAATILWTTLLSIATLPALASLVMPA